MSELPSEMVEQVKKLCAEHGFEFVRIEGDKVIVADRPPLDISALQQQMHAAIGGVFDNEVVRYAPDGPFFSNRSERRQRHGKRPKFHRER